MKNKYLILIIGLMCILCGGYISYFLIFLTKSDFQNINFVELGGSIFLMFIGYAFIKIYLDRTRKAIKEDTLDGKMTIMED